MPLSLLAMTKTGVLVSTVFCLLGVVLLRFVAKLYRVRKEFRDLQRQGLPMPPHNLFFGHISLAAGIFRSLPKRASTSYLGDEVRRRYPHLDEAFYLDLWPFAPRILIIISPEMTHEYTQGRYLPKHSMIQEFLVPIAGTHNLIGMEGSMWKQWRAILNPSFSAGQVTNMIPGIVDEVVVFRDLLRERASEKGMFQLEELMLSLSFDIIGRVVMDHRFNSQRAENRMLSALGRQIACTKFEIDPNPLELVNVFRPVKQWYNARTMNSYLSHHLDLRYNNTRMEGIKGTCVVDLALQSHHISNPSSEGKTTSVTSPLRDAAFRELLVNQIKVLLFAGHDTTASSAVYVLHLLSRHPTTLARVREEHESVFGPNITELPTVIGSNPYKLNDLPITLAVIKETLRLFPPAAAVRAGQSDFFLSSSSTNSRFPTENFFIWGDHHGLHRNPRYWVRPEEFLPKRWLVSEGDPLYPVKDAWRPFEKGPRRCIGQELAIAELKIILALTVREFKIEDAYKEWDSKMGTAAKERAGVHGERAYQFIRNGGHPSELYPCRVESLIS